MAFADAADRQDPYLEVKSLGIEVVARYRRDFAPRLLPVWKRWLRGTIRRTGRRPTRSACYLIGPLLVRPSRARRADARLGGTPQHVGPARGGGRPDSVGAAGACALDVAYDVARRLHPDPNDLIHKAVGWMLREAGKTDVARLERYLRANGASIPRTTVALCHRAVPAGETARVARRDAARDYRAGKAPGFLTAKTKSSTFTAMATAATAVA